MSKRCLHPAAAAFSKSGRDFEPASRKYKRAQTVFEGCQSIHCVLRAVLHVAASRVVSSPDLQTLVGCMLGSMVQ
jgi:hypothetical protein